MRSLKVLVKNRYELENNFKAVFFLSYTEKHCFWC